MLTAAGEEADRRRAEEAGVDEFLTKPFDPVELVGRVREMLAGPE
jgi:DNA-binding response OmpR family regulator